MPRLQVLSYDLQMPSFRYRIAPLLAELERRGWHCEVDRLPLRRYGLRLWDRRTAIRTAQVVLLHKLRLAPWEMAWLSRLNPATLFDFDDAIWLSQSSIVGKQPIHSRSRERAFAATARRAVLTVAGNAYLAARAKAAGARVEVVPTAVDVAAVPLANTVRRVGAIAVWIGLPGNLQYLEPLRPVFARLVQRHAGFRLRVISSRGLDWNDVPVEFVPWAPGIEATNALLGADIGLMPLADDAFTRGKCAFKLLQYMAASLPCVASPVGANFEVVGDGVTGLLASTPQEWEAALDRLLGDSALREAMGRAARHKAETAYDLRVVSTHAADLVERVALKETPGRPKFP